MSEETREWLNENVLMGFIEDREHWADNNFAVVGVDGAVKPWWAGEDYTNGYAGPVPVEAVEDLFSWEAQRSFIMHGVYVDDPYNADGIDGIDAEGRPYRIIHDDRRVGIIRPDTSDVLNVRMAGYEIHQYKEGLVQNVENLLDDKLAIDSAGLLRRGGVAWVSVSLPETVVSNSGFPMRNQLLSCTSLDSTYQTTHMRAIIAAVCDNGLRLSMSDREAPVWKTKHTSGSNLRIADAREALGILYEQTEEMVELFDRLADWDVSDREFRDIRNLLQPLPEQKVNEEGKITNQRAINSAEERRSEITLMYKKDQRAAPWDGTALGVLQAFSTWGQHVSNSKGNKVEKNMAEMLSGKTGVADALILDTIADVTGVDRQLVLS